MYFIWKGKYKSEEQLDKGNLPENAVKFREPESVVNLNMYALIFIIPVVLFCYFMVFLKKQMGFPDIKPNLLGIPGFLLSLITLIPHELLHGLMFPQEAEVTFWYSLKKLTFFVHSTYPVSKMRFIWISLCPNIFFGLLPLLVWLFIPFNNNITDLLINYGVFCLLLGAGDYVNVTNTIRQMPKNAVTQLSGFHSYWYMTEENVK